MKIAVAINRVFVGLLFIISGLIKLNDPLGFSYKLQEYFSPDVLNLPFLDSYALLISVVLVIFEVVLGIFLLIGYKPKFTVWSLLLMILFFTFLTFYSAYFDKVKDCGCFGDALKLTPWESFTKDIILLFFIIILFIGLRYIKPLFSSIKITVIALLSFIFCLWLAYHVLLHLPVIDFRAYHVGANISEGMSIPENAPKPVVEYYWKFKVDGKEETIKTMGDYPTVKGDFVGVDTKIISEGYQPKIYDFTMENSDGENVADSLLTVKKLVVIVAYNVNKMETEGANKLAALSKRAKEKGYNVIGLTSSDETDKENVKSKFGLDFDFYLCDEKALKTIIRSNPGAVVLHTGTIVQKEAWSDFEKIKF